MRNNKHVHILFKDGQGKSFADIYMRKVGFAVDCIASSKDTFKNPQAVELLRKYNIGFDKTERYVTLKVTDEQTEKDCLILAKICYDSYKEK
jgi:hypothetical protein